MLSTEKLLILLHAEELVKKIGAQNTSHPLGTECFSKIVRTDKDDFIMSEIDGFCGFRLKRRGIRLDNSDAHSKNPGARHPQTLRLEGGEYRVVQTKAGGRSAEEATPGKDGHTTASSWSFIDHKKNPASHFGWGRRVLSGMRIAANTQAFEGENVIVKMLLQYDGGTYGRPYDGKDIKAVMEYLKSKRHKLKTSVSELVTMPRQHNEALIYVKWLTDGTSQLTICDESLNSKVTTLFRKIIMDRCLKQREGDTEVNIPVSFLIEGKAPAYFNVENLTSLLAEIKEEMKGQGVDVSDKREILGRIVENTYNETFKTQCYPHYDVLASMLVKKDDFYFELIAEKERSGTDKFKLLHYLLHSNNISALKAYMENIFSKIEEGLAIVQFITEFPFDKISHPGQYNPEQYFDVKHEREKKICKEKTSIITTYLNKWLKDGRVSKEKNIETLKRLVLATVSQDDSALQYVDHEKLSSEYYRAVVLAAVSKNGLALKYASAELKKDREVVLAAVEQNGMALEYVGHEELSLKGYREVVLAAVKKDGHALQCVNHEKLRPEGYPDVVLAAVKKDGHALQCVDHGKLSGAGCHAVVLAAVEQNGLALRHASPSLQGDYGVVLAAVEQNGMALQYASAELKKDRKVVLAAVKEYGMALEYVDHEELSGAGCHAVVLAAVRTNGLALRHASAELKKDGGVVLAAVKQNGMALQYASPSLQGDYGVVLAAVKEYGMALRHASAELKKDGGVVLAAVEQNGMALQYASAELKKDGGVVLAAVKEYGMALRHASAELKKDGGVVLAAVEQNGMALQYASAELKKDRKVVLAAVEQNGMALEFAPEKLRDDCAVVQAAFERRFHRRSCYDSLKFAGEAAVLAAVKQNGMALQYASEAVQKGIISKDSSRLEHASPSLQGDYGVVLAAVAQNGMALRHASAELKKDGGVVLAAVEQNGMALQYASPSLQGDYGVVLAAVEQNGMALQYASAELKKDGGVVLAAVEQNGMALQYASPSLQGDYGVVLAAVEQKGMALQYASEAVQKGIISKDSSRLEHASPSLQGDYGVVLAAVAQNGMALEHASAELKKDGEVVSAAIAQNRMALKHASKEVKIEFIRKFCWSGTWSDIKEIIDIIGKENFKELFLSENGEKNHALDLLFWRDGEESVRILRHLSKEKIIEMQVDIDVGKLLYNLSKGKYRNLYVGVTYVEGRSDEIGVCSEKLNILLEHLSPEQINSLLSMHEGSLGAHWVADAECLKANILKIIQESLQTSEKLQKSSDVVLAVVAQYGLALKYASAELKKDRKVVLAAVRTNGLALYYASAELKKDGGVVLAAVRTNGLALYYASAELKKYREVILAAVAQNGKALKYVDHEELSLKGYHEVVLAAVSKYGWALEYASAALQGDREFILKAVAQNGEALKYAPAGLQGDREFILEAVAQNSEALRFVSSVLNEDFRIKDVAEIQGHIEKLKKEIKEEKYKVALFSQEKLKNQKIIAFKKVIDSIINNHDAMDPLSREDCAALNQGLFRHESRDIIVGLTSKQGQAFCKKV